MKRAAALHIRIVHVIKVLYYISKTFGLASFKLTENRVTGEVLLNTKLRDKLLNNFWFFFILSLMILGAIMDFNAVWKIIFKKEKKCLSVRCRQLLASCLL